MFASQVMCKKSFHSLYSQDPIMVKLKTSSFKY